MAYTSTDLGNIETAITELLTGSRVVRVTIAGKTTEFAQSSLDDLLKMRGVIRRELQASQSIFNKVKFASPS